MQVSRSSRGFSYCMPVEWLLCQLKQLIRGCLWCRGIHCRPLPYSCHISSKRMMARCQVDKHSFTSLTSCSNYHVLHSLDKKLSGSDTVCLLVGQCTILDWINMAHSFTPLFFRHVFVQKSISEELHCSLDCLGQKNIFVFVYLYLKNRYHGIDAVQVTLLLNGAYVSQCCVPLCAGLHSHCS